MKKIRILRCDVIRPQIYIFGKPAGIYGDKQNVAYAKHDILNKAFILVDIHKMHQRHKKTDGYNHNGFDFKDRNFKQAQNLKQVVIKLRHIIINANRCYIRDQAKYDDINDDKTDAEHKCVLALSFGYRQNDRCA